MEKTASIVEGDITRLGPTMMTTMTTCFGIISMAVSHGTESELLMPIAITVFGGMLTFTFLTHAIAHSVYSIIGSIPYECPRT